MLTFGGSNCVDVGESFLLTFGESNCVDFSGSMDASDFEDGCRARLGTSAFELFTLEWLVEQVHTYPTENVFIVVLQKSTPPQIRQLILYYY